MIRNFVYMRGASEPAVLETVPPELSCKAVRIVCVGDDGSVRVVKDRYGARGQMLSALPDHVRRAAP